MIPSKTRIEAMLRNVPHLLADLGLNFTTAAIATIDGLGGNAGAVRFRAGWR